MYAPVSKGTHIHLSLQAKVNEKKNYLQELQDGYRMVREREHEEDDQELWDHPKFLEAL
jgi:hypothetical protein